MQKASLYFESFATLLFCYRVNKVWRSLLNHNMWLINPVKEIYQLLVIERWYVFEGAFY